MLERQGRWDKESEHVRFTGGNQSAEGMWGIGKSNLKSRCVHRGAAVKHATAHACSSLFLAQHPGMENLGRAWEAFLSEHVDSAQPSSFFVRSGWSGLGVDARDKEATMVVNQNLEPLPEKKKGQKRMPRVVLKRPAASSTVVLHSIAKRPAKGSA